MLTAGAVRNDGGTPSHIPFTTLCFMRFCWLVQLKGNSIFHSTRDRREHINPLVVSNAVDHQMDEAY
jgi:hypothetical protein